MRVWGLGVGGFKVQGVGCEFWFLVLRGEGIEFRMLGVGCGVDDLGFSVSGSWFMVRD